MIRSASLYTFEIDDVDKAVHEVHSQLRSKLTLQKNTVGILHCSFDFVASGVVAALGVSLPFPIVGVTSAGQAVNGISGSMMLTLLVLTSDDVEFVPARTKGHPEDFKGSLEQSFKTARSGSSLPLKLVLAFPPIIEKYSGDDYIEVFTSLCGDVPVFGSLAVEEEILDYTRNATFYNGDWSADEAVYVLVCGNVTPRFFVATVLPTASRVEAGIVTKAEGNILYDVNGTRVLTFFEDIGFVQKGDLFSGAEYMPFLLAPRKADKKLGTPFVRGLVRFEQDGSALFRGTVYENTLLTISTMSVDDILTGSREAVETLNAEKNVDAALIYSCLVRRMALAQHPQLELEKVCATICPDIPFMMAYSGGELCPVATGGTTIENRFHNFSFIVCVL